MPAKYVAMAAPAMSAGHTNSRTLANGASTSSRSRELCEYSSARTTDGRATGARAAVWNAGSRDGGPARPRLSASGNVRCIRKF